jgi:predicted metal-dependent phosphoesterase TrpH
LPKQVFSTLDLHTHSTASDGRLSPGKLVEKSAAVGLEVIALTDHDTVAGLDEAWAAARTLQVTFIPGVEISTTHSGGECHILGYFLDYRSPALQELLQQFRESRLTRGHDMVKRLAELGLPLSWQRVQELTQGGTITRAHVAEALLEAKLVSTRQEAFDRYIGHGRPAYISRFKLMPEEAVRLIRQVHGIPVLAHPTYAEPALDWQAPVEALIPWPFLEGLVQAGLLGLEVYYGAYSSETMDRLAAIAAHYGLIPTGGSDFHGHDEHPPLGCAPVPASVLPNLLRAARTMESPWMDLYPPEDSSD